MLSLWIGFIILIVLLLALDLGVFHRKAHVVKVQEALIWSGMWVVLALLFNVFLYFGYEDHWLGMDLPNAEPDGQAAAVFFFTGYVVEKSLSVDNIFVIAMIFSYFAVPPAHQHRVLYWGILGALLMRGAMILAGACKLGKARAWDPSTRSRAGRVSCSATTPSGATIARSPKRLTLIRVVFPVCRSRTKMSPVSGPLPKLLTCHSDGKQSVAAVKVTAVHQVPVCPVIIDIT